MEGLNEFLTHLAELGTDPAHLAFEVLTTAVIEGAILGLLWPLIKRRIKRDLTKQHIVLDREHGVAFHGDLDPDDPIAHLSVEEITALRELLAHAAVRR